MRRTPLADRPEAALQQRLRCCGMMTPRLSGARKIAVIAPQHGGSGHPPTAVSRRLVVS
jgi:hypothetical protein